MVHKMTSSPGSPAMLSSCVVIALLAGVQLIACSPTKLLSQNINHPKTRDSSAKECFGHVSELQGPDINRLAVKDCQEIELRHLGETDHPPFAHLPNIRHLNLSFAGIKSIGRNAFVGLGQLEEVDLSYNDLQYIDEDSFRPVASTLRILRLHAQRIQIAIPAAVFGGLTSLEFLSLPGVDGQLLQNDSLELPSLAHVHFACHYTSTATRPDSVNIGGDIFRRVGQVESWSVRGCPVHGLDKDTFRGMSRLKFLAMSCTASHQTTGESNAIHTALDAIAHSEASLHDLVLDYVRKREDGYLLLNYTLANSNLRSVKRLSLRGNNLHVENYALPMFRNASVEHIVIGYNPLMEQADHYTVLNERLRTSAELLPMKFLDISHTALVDTQKDYVKDFCDRLPDITISNYFPEEFVPPWSAVSESAYTPSLYESTGSDGGIVQKMTQSLQSLHGCGCTESHLEHAQLSFSRSDPPVVQAMLAAFNGHPELRSLNMSHCNLPEINEPLSGLEKLQVFDLSHTELSFIGEGSLDNLESLQVLLLRGTHLNYVNLRDVFDNLTQLQILDLASNPFSKDIPAQMFSRLSNLRYLSLRENSLLKLDFNTSGLVRLEVLDLSYNKITSINYKLLSKLVRLRHLMLNNNGLEHVYHLPGLGHLEFVNLSNNRIPFLLMPVVQDLTARSAKEGIIHLDLSGNPFICSCDVSYFLEWMQFGYHPDSNKGNLRLDNIESYTCRLDTQLTSIWEVDSISVYRCPVSIEAIIIIIVAMSVLLVLVLVVACFYHVRICLFLYIVGAIVRQRLCGCCSRRDDGPSVQYKYAAFISHEHRQDRHWVLNELRGKETAWQTNFCIGERDFIPGMAIVDNIVNAIDNSRRTVVLLTPAFCRSNWCDLELNMALVRGREHIIVIYFQSVDTKFLPLALRSFTKLYTYLEWPGNDPLGRRWFWRSLHSALKPAEVV